MALTIPCQHCGTPVSYTEEDRGYEVYCNSCARAIQIPTASEEVEPKPLPPAEAYPTRAGIFSDESQASLQQEIAGRETCLCGADVPYRLEDLGDAVYCSSCGTKIDIGSSLESGPYRSVRQAEAEADVQTTPGAAEEPSSRGVRSTAAKAAAVFALIAACMIGLWVWQNPRQPDGAPSRQTSGRPAPGAEITLARIEQLPNREDLIGALVEAQVWRDKLVRGPIPDDDPRPARLNEVIAELELRLTPEAEGPSSVFKEFRRAVDGMAASLKQYDLAAARQWTSQAETLLAEHAEELAPYRHRFGILKERLEEEETLSDAVKGIDQLLERAESLAARGQVTEALEAEAEARFLAIGTLLTDAEAAMLDERQRRVGAELRFASGRRAVQDAKRCAAADDIQARDRQVRRAMALLPGLAESRVGPLLAQVRPWHNAARTAAAPTAYPATESQIARQIEFRDHFEAIWEHYGTADTAGLLDAALRLDKLPQSGDAELDRMRTRVESPLFDLLEWHFAERLNATEDEAEQHRRTQELRRLLNRAEPWKSNPRWAALDKLVSQRKTPRSR